MATRTVKAGAGNFSAAGTWVEGVAPTTADDVVTNASSTGTLTIDASGTLACRSFTIANGVALTWANGSTLNVGDGSGGAVNLTGAGTVTNNGGTIQFVSTSTNGGAGWNITTGGKIMPTTNFNTAGAWTCQDAYSASNLNIAHAGGTWNTNGKSITGQQVSSTGAATRALIFGASTITVTLGGGTPWNMTGSGLTITPGTSTIVLNNAAGSPVFAGNGLTYASMTLAGANSNTTGANTFSGTVIYSGTGNASLSAANTFTTLTRTGTATLTDAFTLLANQIVSGTLTLSGNSATNRLSVTTNSVGTARTITCNGTVVINQCVEFTDITGAGSASWNLSGSSVGGGTASLTSNRGGNSGITFTTSATQTWQGTSGGNWSNVAKWTSRVPLAQDDVVIASAFSASQTITCDIPAIGRSINWTGTTGSPAWTISSTALMYGSLTLAAGMGTISVNAALELCGRGAFTLTSAGKTFAGTNILYTFSVTGSMTLQDALSCSCSAWHLNGTFDANGKTVSNSASIVINDFSLGGNVVNMGSGTWTLSSTLAVTVWTAVTGQTINASTSTIAITGATANTRTFAGAGVTYNVLSYTVAGSTGGLTITGSAGLTFATINFTDASASRTIIFPASVTTTITANLGLNISAVAGQTMTIQSSSAGTAATIAVSGIIRLEVTRTAIKDITGPGLTKMFAYSSTSTSGNSGISFVDSSISSADTGSGADAGTAPSASFSSADTGLGTDASEVIGPSGQDIGTGTEASSIGATTSGSDDGTGVDGGSVSTTTQNTDTGAGTEVGSLAAVGADSDTGTTVEASTLAATLTGTESAAGSESSSGFAALDGSDVGSMSESSSPVAFVANADTGVMLETGAAVSSALMTTETGAGVEIGTVVNILSASDLASAVESARIGFRGAETGHGFDLGAITLVGAVEVTWYAQLADGRWVGQLADGRWVATTADRRWNGVLADPPNEATGASSRLTATLSS